MSSHHVVACKDSKAVPFHLIRAGELYTLDSSEPTDLLLLIISVEKLKTRDYKGMREYRITYIKFVQHRSHIVRLCIFNFNVNDWAFWRKVE